MKKPKWQITINRIKYPKFLFIPRWRSTPEILWKDKYNSPRHEISPSYYFAWLWWEIQTIQGHCQDWEWYLWVTRYNEGDEEKAKRSWPWGKEDDDGNWIQNQPWLKYRE